MKSYWKNAVRGMSIGLSLGLMLSATPADAALTDTPDSITNAWSGPAVGAYALQGIYGWDKPAPNWTGMTGSSPTGVPSNPGADKPSYYQDKGSDGLPCHARAGQTKPAKGCVYGDPKGDESWVVVGNSKSGTFQDLLGEIGARESWSVRAMTKSATAFTPGVFSGESRTWNDAVLAEIARTKPDVVAFVPSGTEQGDYSGQLNSIVTKTLNAGAGRVVLLWDPPTQSRTSALETKAKQIAATNSRVSFVSVADWVCNGSSCPKAIGGITVNAKGSHLTSTFADTLVNPLHARLHAAGLADTHPDQVKRVAGKDRYETAALLAYDGNYLTREVYVASGLNWPDALAASAQTDLGTKLVLTRPNSLPPAVIGAEWLYATYAHARVLGGPGVVSDAVMDRLAEDYETVSRTSGASRYETAVLIAEKEHSLSPTQRVFLVSGQNWADAVSAASVAGEGDVLLLTHPGHLTKVSKEFIGRAKPSEVIVVGGTGAVSNTVVSQVNASVPGASVTRVAGENRYDTSARLVTRYAGDADHVYLATGLDFPDALAAGQDGSPVLLTKPDSLPAPVSKALREMEDLTGATVVGGYSAVGAEVEDQLRVLVSQ